MDYQEEQLQELEAIQAIYPSECTLLDTASDDDDTDDEENEQEAKNSKPVYNHAFTIIIRPQEAPGIGHDHGTPSGVPLSCTWRFAFPATYPSVEPLINLIASENIDNESEQTLIDIASRTATESVGMPMCYTVISAIQQELTDQKDLIVGKLQYERDAKYRIEEEATRKKLEGTRVTMESFLAWRERFDEETGETERRIKEEAAPKKLTGKELFVTGRTSVNTEDELFFEGVGELSLDDIPVDDDDEADS